jgi:uncharacterized protein (UPF0254 family)
MYSVRVRTTALILKFLSLCFTKNFISVSCHIQIMLYEGCKTPENVGFEVLTEVSTEMAVFWVVAPSTLVEVYQCFRGPSCLHHQGREY